MTNPITSYTTLVSAIVDYYEDDSTEFKAYIPVAIDLAEQRLTREIDSTSLKFQTRVSSNANSRFITKPTGYRFGFNLKYVDPTGEIKTLIKTTESYIEDYWPWGTTSVGCPKYYTDYDNSSFLIAPTVSNAGDFPLAYSGRPTPLTAAVSTNIFTQIYSDLLYAATLVEQSGFARQASMRDTLEAAYQTKLQDIVNEGRRERRDSGLEPTNLQGNINTLNGNQVPE